MTMWTAAISALAAIVGILLGGAVRAWESAGARKRDTESLLAALVAEVEALVRLMDHRQFLQGILQCGVEARAMVETGKGQEEASFLTIYMKHNYFSTYEASVGKIGILHPYMADRITRFYTYVKAASENYDPGSPFQSGLTAETVVQIVESDLQLLHTALMLGRHIATFHNMAPPPGITDPFVQYSAQEPAMPVEAPQPSLSDRGKV
jgi:hypothetical protein